MRELTVKQAARRLGVDERTVQRWVKNGTLRAYKLGGTWRIPEASVDDFERRCGARPEPVAVVDLIIDPAAINAALMEAVGPLLKRIRKQDKAFRSKIAETQRVLDAFVGDPPSSAPSLTLEAGFDFPEGFEQWPSEIRKRWLDEYHALYFGVQNHPPEAS